MTIEELDSQFIPCDITPGMYDTDVDDYTLFLAKTFGQPGMLNHFIVQDNNLQLCSELVDYN